jgi:hypothetical protein
MRIYQANIAQGIGDNINALSYAELAIRQGKFDQIHYAHYSPIVRKEKNNDPKYWQFLHELGTLFFSKPPFVYYQGEQSFPFRDAEGLIADFGIVPEKPNYKYLLCKGTSLNLGEEYIVITTKIRYFDRNTFYRLAPKIWNTLTALSKRYKIVILGERVVEMCPDYLAHGANQIYGIYDQIIANLPADRILDLTISALGISAPTLAQIQQDCLIMKEAKFTMTLGIGGNFCMAMACANLIGYRIDNVKITDDIFSRRYNDAVVVKDFDVFIQTMMSYL